MSPNLVRRILFAAVAIPSVVVLAYLGRWVFAVFLALAGALGARELYDFARRQGIEPLGRTGMVFAALAPLATALVVLAPGRTAQLVREGYLLALFVMLVMAAGLARRAPESRPLAALAVTTFGVLYAGFLPSFALMLRHPHPTPFERDATVGMSLLFYPLVLTWAGDTAAMAGGKVFGGPKLAPVISPRKTWSGGVAGVFVTVAVSVIYAALVLVRAGISISLGEALLFGLLISLAGQIGDLAESLFKREVGVKDSSDLIPGHGGVLDRLDSLYFALPATALLFRLAGIV